MQEINKKEKLKEHKKSTNSTWQIKKLNILNKLKIKIFI